MLSPWSNDSAGTVTAGQTGKAALVPTSVRLCPLSTVVTSDVLAAGQSDPSCTLLKIKTADGTYKVDPKTGKVTYMSGPASPWPFNSLLADMGEPVRPKDVVPETRYGKVLACAKDMAKGLAVNAGRAITRGFVTTEVSDARFKKCQECVITEESYEQDRKTLKQFNAESGFDFTLPPANEYVLSKDDRCRICGCAMRQKTKINVPGESLCPLGRWD